MDEQTANDQNMPNPLQRLAAQVAIHVEKFEIPIALALLTQPGVAKMGHWARVAQDRNTKPQQETKQDHIRRAIARNPQMNDADIARIMHCEKSTVHRTRKNIDAEAKKSL